MRLVVGPRLFTVALVSSLVGCLTAFGCSLGLDRSLLSRDGSADGAGDELEPDGEGDGAPVDAPTDRTTDGPPPDGQDGAGDSPSSSSLDGGTCNTNEDCQALAGDAGGCVHSATCDMANHVCVLDVCPASSCQASVCDVKANKCSSARSYAFAPASFAVSTGGVVASGPARAIAAAWPFVFVATTNGIAAFNVVDPLNATPPSVTIHGVPFVADETVAVGRVVYFVTSAQGMPPGYRQAIAWVTVPEDPFITDLYATAAWVETTQHPLSQVLTGTAGPLLVYGSSALYPSALVVPPLGDTTLAAYDNADLPAGAVPLASSGSRLVSFRYDGTSLDAFFAIVKGAGTSKAKAGAEVQAKSLGPLDNQKGLATGNDGSVLWEAAQVVLDDAGVSEGVSSAVVSWLLESATDDDPTPSSTVSLVDYNPTASGAVIGAPAWIDSNTALGLAIPSSAAPKNTLVQVVTKKPAALTPGRSLVLPVAPAAMAVASSNGFGYALLQDDPMNATCTVQIVAPACKGTGD